MKLSFILSVAVMFQAFATGYAQTARITLSMHDVKIEEVLDKIEEQSEFYFLFNQKLVDMSRKVNIDVSGTTINEVLNVLFDKDQVEYAVYDRQIIVSPAGILDVSGLKLQGIAITGTVTDDAGEPIPGVNVTVKGTLTGVITDANGNYSMTVPNRDVVLVFSFVGYAGQEFLVGDKRTINVTLSEERREIEEVVVVGYGTVSRKNLTTAISKVTTDDVQKAANSNMTQLLLGRAAGLQAIATSNQPGGNVSISIRGSGAPVYVVDGVVMPAGSLEPGKGTVTYPLTSIDRGGMAGLNPEDIESIEILKDASAAIYGLGAANGVILITTKKGKEGPLKINYDGSFSKVYTMPLPPPLNSQQYMELVNVFSKEAYLFRGRMEPYGDTPYDDGWSLPFTPDQIRDAETYDWTGPIMRTGQINNHTITINGGTKAVNYYISGNYFNHVGNVVNSGMERFALRSNIGLALASFLKLSATMNFNYNDYLNSQVGSAGTQPNQYGALEAARYYLPWLPIKDENGIYTRQGMVPNGVGMLEVSDNTVANGAFLNFVADVDILPKMLSARLQYGNNLEMARRSLYIPSTIWYEAKYLSRGNLGENRRMNQTMEATLMFNRNFYNIVTADIMVGVSRYYNESSGISTSYDGQYDAIGNDNLRSVMGSVTPNSDRAASQKRSQFARATFDILDRYVVSGTLRHDGTDKFFPEKKYAWFPAVSLAWKISNESFLKDVSWLNLLKIRGSYGVTGSDNLGTTLYGTYNPSNYHVVFNEGLTRYVPILKAGLDYPNVTWQKTTMQDIGIDFYILKDRISGSFDLYRNDITDRLGTANTAGLSLFGTEPINGSHQRREGWDATLNTKNIVRKDFSWSTLLTFTKYKTLWIERMPNYDYNNYEKRGVVTNAAAYYYKTAGLINIDKSNMPAHQPVGMQFPGFPIIADLNGDGEITADDIYLSDRTPRLYFGFGNTFRYKGFDLDIFMYSQLGLEKSNPLYYNLTEVLANGTSNVSDYAYDIWNSQTNPNGTIPGVARFYTSVALPENVGVNYNFYDASFLRVRNITLGYNVRGSQLGAVGSVISNARIYVDAQNPILFTKFKTFDPEMDTGLNVYPQTRTFSVGVKISFN